MSIIETLTEGMVHRNMQQEGAALLNKWANTGLLEGLSDDNQKASMARLLENQARELLREANTMAGGDVEGFAAVAFPIARPKCPAVASSDKPVRANRLQADQCGQILLLQVIAIDTLLVQPRDGLGRGVVPLPKRWSQELFDGSPKRRAQR